MSLNDEVSQAIILVLHGDFGDSFSHVFTMTRRLVSDPLTILHFSSRLVSLCETGYVDGLLQRRSDRTHLIIGKAARVTRTNANSLFYKLSSEGERLQIDTLNKIRESATHFPYPQLRSR